MRIGNRIFLLSSLFRLIFPDLLLNLQIQTRRPFCCKLIRNICQSFLESGLIRHHKRHAFIDQLLLPLAFHLVLQIIMEQRDVLPGLKNDFL